MRKLKSSQKKHVSLKIQPDPHTEIPFIETSALTATNVDAAFKKLIYEIFKLFKVGKLGNHQNEYEAMFFNQSTTNFDSNKNSNKLSHNNSNNNKQGSHNLSGLKNTIVLSQVSHKSFIEQDKV